MGKTRLALEVATQQLQYFANGVFFVALAPLNSAELMIPAIAEAVDFQFSPGGEPKQQLLDYFREKSLLLVMDNFEHLLAGVGLVSDILGAAPGVKIIVTSREKLNLQAETIFIVEGMAFPERGSAEDLLQYSAVKLFVQDVRRAQPGFQLSEADFSHVVRICRLVQGMPLGLLLAAAWVEMLSLQEIAEEISQSLDFLETELRDVLERQRSIRVVFEYSWNLLSEEERVVFARLSVFRGGFTRQAAQTVAGASLRHLMTLLNKSLLWRKPDSGRYEIHELLRQYAEQQLVAAAEAEAVRDRHLKVFMEMAEQAEIKLRGAEQHQWFEQLDLELDNLHAALEWSLVRDVQQGLRLAGALLWFWNIKGYWHEGPAWLSQLLAAPGASAPTLARAKALVAAGNLTYWGNNNHPTAHAWLEESITIYRQLQRPDPWGLGYALSLYGEVLNVLGERALAQNVLNESLAIGESLSQAGKWIEAMALMSLAGLAETSALTQAWLEKSAALFRELGDEAQLGPVLARLAWFYIDQKDYASAQAYAEESLRLHQKSGDKMGVTWLLKLSGDLALAQADYAQATAHYEAGLKGFRTLGSKEGIAYALANLGQAHFAQGDVAGARALWEEALTRFEEMEHKVGRAWLLRELAALALVQEDTDLALARYQEALRLHQEMGSQAEAVQTLEDLAQVRLKQGEFDRAMRLLSAAQALAATDGKARPVAEQARFEQTLAIIRAALGEQAEALWARGQGLSLAQAIEMALG
jgi:predicted ATPase